MAKRVFETVVDVDRIQWKLAGSREVVAEMLFDKIHPDSKAPVLIYGLKQYITDGSATSEGASRDERVAGLRERIQKVTEGKMDERTSGNRMADASIFEAVVGTGQLEDTPENRKTWSTLSVEERKSFLQDDAVVKYMKSHAKKTADKPALLAKFTKSAPKGNGAPAA